MMNNELTDLATSGATTLVALMTTESWPQARALADQLLVRGGPGFGAIEDLDDARTRISGSGAAQAQEVARELVGQWGDRLRRMVAAGSATGDELRGFHDCLERLARVSAGGAATVRNEISGGVQHAPVIQAGSISGLTFHGTRPGP